MSGPTRTRLAIAVALALNGAITNQALAAPAGGQVTAGAATIQQSGTQTLITQSTDRAALNWMTFSIGAAESVIFRQPSSSSVALNRVIGGSPSEIFGTLQANGHVFLINPSGILFGRGANVDVGALVASTLSLSNADFMAGRYNFTGGATAGTVTNDGTLRAANGGYIALIGNQVRNNGTIVATNGTVALGAGESMVLDFHGDGLLSLKVNAGAAKAKIENSGEIYADGGAVIMSAKAKDALLDTVLNVEGYVQARGFVERDGHIYLDGGPSGVTRVAGTLDASSAEAKGGEVKVLGEYVGLFDNAKIDVSGRTGGGTVLVGGDFQGNNPGVPNATRAYVAPNATINADSTASGDGGKVIVWSDDSTRFDGTISARGGALGGNGGFVEVSGKRDLAFQGRVDTGAPRGNAGTLLLDPETLIVDGGGPNALPGSTGDGALADNRVQFGENAGATTTITEATLESLNANIVLEGTKRIETGPTAFTDGKLTIANNRNLTLRTRNRLSDAGGVHGIDLTNGGANAPEIVLQGDGNFSATSGYGNGTNNGPIAAPITLGPVTTEGGKVTVTSNDALTISGAIATRPASGSNSDGGSVVLEAGGNIVLDGNPGSGAINTRGRGSGAGGEVFITRLATAGTGDIVLAGSIRSGGGNRGPGGGVTVVNPNGNIYAEGRIDVSRGGNAADATPDGTIQLQANGFIDGTGAMTGTPGFFIGATNGALLARTTNTTGRGYIELPGGDPCLCLTQNAVASVAFETRTADDLGYVFYESSSSVAIATAGGSGALTAPSGAKAADVASFAGIKTVSGTSVDATTVPSFPGISGSVTVFAVDVAGTGALPSISVQAPIVTTPAAGTGLGGGFVDIEASGNVTSTAAGTLDTRGASGAPGGTGGAGGSVLVASRGGRGKPTTIALGAPVDASGGAGAAGTLVDPGGDGGPGGMVMLQNDYGSIVAHDVIAIGGAAGATGGAGAGAPGMGGLIELITGNAKKGGTIGQQPNTRFESDALLVVATDDVTLTNSGNKASFLAATFPKRGDFSYVNNGGLTIDQIFGERGITTEGGNVSLTVAGPLTIQEEIDTRVPKGGPGGGALTIDAASIAINTARIRTGGTQTYGSDVTIGDDVKLISTDADIRFARALDADVANLRALTIDASMGKVTFSGSIGVNQPFADFDVTASPNTIVFNGTGPQSVNVNGPIALNGSLLLEQPLTLNAGTGNIALNGPVNTSAGALTGLTVNANRITFGGDIQLNGGAADFQNVNTARFPQEMRIDTDMAGGFNGAGNVLFGAATVLRPIDKTAKLTLDVSVDGGGALGDASLGVLAKGMEVTIVRNFSPLVGSSRVDLQACKLEYSIVSPK